MEGGRCLSNSSCNRHNFEDTSDGVEEDGILPSPVIGSISSQDYASSTAGDEEVVPSSPRELHEDCSSSFEFERASSKASSSDSEGTSNPKSDIHWPSFFRALKKTSAKRLHSLSPFGVTRLSRRKKNKNLVESAGPPLEYPLEAYCFKPSWKNFSIAELRNATSDFSRENLIGEGGYAEVYKGILSDGQHVAIKRLTRGNLEEMTADFLAELGIIVHVDHPNTARLVGYSVEEGMHLVLQLSPHGSLASLIHGGKDKLEWEVRYKIALGTAEGLHYLHEGGQKRIIHRDIKASNILLTESFDPQISDFGLAKWLPEHCTHHTVSKYEGTFGYLPPEFFLHGIVDEKTDVYAYGVLLLELITGRLALDESQQSLVMWAKPFLEKKSLNELIDVSLSDQYDSEQMNNLVSTACLCISPKPSERPQMSEVVQFLRGHDDGLEHVTHLERTDPEELVNVDDDASSPTTHLNDINQHLQVALGF